MPIYRQIKQGFRLIHPFSAKRARAVSRFSFLSREFFPAFHSGSKPFHIHSAKRARAVSRLSFTEPRIFFRVP